MSDYSEQTGWRQFLALCLRAETVEELEKIMNLYLTQEEREAVAGRYLIVRELLKGELTQRDMAQKLHVSIAKITRGSNGLKIIDDELTQLLRRGIDDDGNNNL